MNTKKYFVEFGGKELSLFEENERSEALSVAADRFHAYVKKHGCETFVDAEHEVLFDCIRFIGVCSWLNEPSDRAKKMLMETFPNARFTLNNNISDKNEFCCNVLSYATYNELHAAIVKMKVTQILMSEAWMW